MRAAPRMSCWTAPPWRNRTRRASTLTRERSTGERRTKERTLSSTRLALWALSAANVGARGAGWRIAVKCRLMTWHSPSVVLRPPRGRVMKVNGVPAGDKDALGASRHEGRRRRRPSARRQMGRGREQVQARTGWSRVVVAVVVGG